MYQESLNEKRVRLGREKALREAIDEIHDMTAMYKSDKERYEESREKVVKLIMKCLR